MADGMVEAADVLRSPLDANEETIPLGAARSRLELGLKLPGRIELKQRLAAVEARLADKQA